MNLLNIYKIILNESPNQAIKFLKEKNLDPATNPKGKRILDDINSITKGDGYTALLTRFHVTSGLPLPELQQLHEYLRINKDFLNRLPKPLVSYEKYRDLRNDIDHLEDQRIVKKVSNQLSPDLRQQAEGLTTIEKQYLKELSKKFMLLTPEQQRHFMKKVFGYKDIKIYIENLQRYIYEVENKQDYNSTKEKIESTDNAHVVYDNPEQDIIIAHINSFDASKTLGCTSAWCITRDTSRFRQYKEGGKKYFFIWDYNYPIQDSNFFIATAYNENNPEGAQTHEHIDDVINF